MKFSNILVIADRDDRQQIALRAALELNQGSNAGIAFTGFVYDSMVEQPKLISPTAIRRLQAALLKDKQTWLEAAAARHATEGVVIESRAVWAKDIGEWVKANVKPASCDLIVKSGNRTESLLYTPTDWHLLREATVPTMIVRDKLRRKPGRVLATVDLGADGSVQKALNRRVLADAAAVAAQLGAELHVVYAVPLSALAQDLDLIDSRALERRTHRALAKEIAALALEFGVPEKHIRLKAGPPERVVDGVASKLKVSLVVMGTTGRKGLKGKLMGNTAEKVLHANRANVLAIRPDN